jgi:REP element-mobilizing transposase RayT
MTAPRQILPGATYLVTRRCSQRQFLLRPCAATTGIFLYVLALAARRFGIQVHAFCVLSNHYHLVVTDPGAQLPAFGQYLDSLVARAVNASLGRWESFWAPSSYSAVALTTPADVLDKAAYVLANPVAAGLVRHGREWPGLWSDPKHLGRTALVARRPKTFFRDTGYLPEHVALALVPPPGFPSAEAFRDQLVAALLEREERHAAEGHSFPGPARVRAQSPWGRPSSGEPRRNLNPRVAARDKWKRIEALARLEVFLADYREAWRSWTAGLRHVLFPAGTYALRVAHGACCHAVG